MILLKSARELAHMRTAGLILAEVKDRLRAQVRPGITTKDLGVVKVALAKHLLSQGQKVKNLFVEAIAHLEVAVRLNPTIYGAYYERGQAYFAVKDFRSAIA